MELANAIICRANHDAPERRVTVQWDKGDTHTVEIIEATATPVWRVVLSRSYPDQYAALRDFRRIVEREWREEERQFKLCRTEG